MKKFILFLLTSSLTVICNASDILVKISDGVDSDMLKAKMESTAARILNEVNDAQAQNRDLNFQTMGVNENVSHSMAMLWEHTPFVCSDELIVEHCITTKSGYQIRNIPLLMKPRGGREFNEDEYQEAVISFDKSGNVERFLLSISQSLYMNIIKNKGVTDLRRNVFSDDSELSSEILSNNKKLKDNYIAKLRRIFSSTSSIKVKIDEIEVMCHPYKKEFYGVTLHQGYSTMAYHDDGYLFLL